MPSRKDNFAVQDPFQTVTVNEFCKIARVGRSRAYEILNSGVVKSVLVGGSRLVLIATWYDHLARLLDLAAIRLVCQRAGKAVAREPGSGPRAFGEPAGRQAHIHAEDPGGYRRHHRSRPHYRRDWNAGALLGTARRRAAKLKRFALCRHRHKHISSGYPA